MIEKTLEKLKAIKLRREGLSYREILRYVPVSKSTLSLWLRDVGLAKRQTQRLTKKRLDAMRRGWETIRAEKLKRVNTVRNRAVQEVSLLNTRECWLIGIALYWAEGAKEKHDTGATLLKFSNSDVSMIEFFQQWLIQYLKLAKNHLKHELYIHENADWLNAKNWWARRLNVSSSRILVYFKKHNPKTKRHNTGDRYHGLIRINVPRSSHLTRTIEGWIQGICKRCGIV